MNVDLVTQNDIQPLVNKINDLAAIIYAQETKGLGKIYNTKELSQRLKVSTKTINNWREARLIEFCKVQSTILYTEKAVLEFLASHSIKRKNSIVNRLKSSNNG